MKAVKSGYERILHEYEIADATNQHFASIVYIREFNKDNSNSSLSDTVDATMEAMITAKCNVQRHNTPRQIWYEEEVEELNKRLREEYQLKAYFTFFAEAGTGKDMEYSRVTIHTTILVREQADIPFFNNVGASLQVTNPAVIAFTYFYHAPSPVFTLQEHPLVHGIVCYKDAKNSDLLYMLYRHDANPLETIMAIVDINKGTVQLLLGTNSSQLDDITLLSPAFHSQNDYAPLYRYSYEKVIGGYCIPTRIILNKERDKFQKAQSIVLSELLKSDNGITYSHDMETYLKMMVEA